MILLKSLAVLATAFVVAWAVTKVLIPLLQRAGSLDIPNARSSHDLPTPRGGGIGIVAGMLAGLSTASVLGVQLPTFELFLAGALVALIGFLDDRSGRLSVGLRLIFQLAAAGIVVFRAGGIAYFPLPRPLDFPTGQLAIPLALIWIVGVTNFYNFLDGIDGFAGLQGAVAGLGVILLGQGSLFICLGFALTGACAGFLLHNWHPAKVFMGDVGSGTVGFILAALPFQLNPAARNDAVFVIGMCLWFFLSDGVFTILRRLSCGEKIWEAHRSHLYQRLVRAGVQQDRVVLQVIGATSALAVLALVAIRFGESSTRWRVIATALGAFAVYYSWVLLRERAFNRRNIPQAGEVLLDFLDSTDKCQLFLKSTRPPIHDDR